MSEPRLAILRLDVEPLESRRLLTATFFDSDSGKVALPVGEATVFLRLRGAGQGTAHVAGDSFRLELVGTSDRTRLWMRSTGSSAALTGLSAASLKSVSASSVVVENATLEFSGAVQRLQLGAVRNTQIELPESDLLDQIRITMGAATDVGINSGQSVKFIRAESVSNTDGIPDTWQAPAFGRVRVKGEMEAELVSTSWVAALPQSVLRGIEWHADHEEGSLFDWEQGGGPNAGGGIFNTGDDAVEVLAAQQIVHSGQFAVRTTITGAYLGENGNRAVRLMRWTDRPWDDNGDVFRSPSYFSTWMYIQENYDPDTAAPGDGGWWNIFQFKSDDIDGVSQPMFSVNIGVNAGGQMVPYLWAAQLATSFEAAPEVTITAGQWVHLEAYYKSTPKANGRIAIYQDGQKIIDVKRVTTVMPGGDETVVWGLGNYTNHIDGGAIPGQATIYFDDAAVGSRRASRFLPREPQPTSSAAATRQVAFAFNASTAGPIPFAQPERVAGGTPLLGSTPADDVEELQLWR